MDTMLAGRFHLDSKKFAVEEVPDPCPARARSSSRSRPQASAFRMFTCSTAPSSRCSPPPRHGHRRPRGLRCDPHPRPRPQARPDRRHPRHPGGRQYLRSARRLRAQPPLHPDAHRRASSTTTAAGRSTPSPARTPSSSSPTTSPSTRPRSSPTRSPPPTPPSSPPRAYAPPSPSASGARRSRRPRTPRPPGRRRTDHRRRPAAQRPGTRPGLRRGLRPRSGRPRLRRPGRAATAGRGLDFAFDCACGVPAVREQAAAALGLGGVLILVGISPRPLTITEGLTFNYLGKQVRGHYGGSPSPSPQLWSASPRSAVSTWPHPSPTTSRSPRPPTRSTGWRTRSATRSASSSSPTTRSRSGPPRAGVSGRRCLREHRRPRFPGIRVWRIPTSGQVKSGRASRVMSGRGRLEGQDAGLRRAVRVLGRQCDHLACRRVDRLGIAW